MWSHPPFQERGWEHPCKKDIVYVQFFPLEKGAGTRLGIGMEKTAVGGGGGGPFYPTNPNTLMCHTGSSFFQGHSQ